MALNDAAVQYIDTGRFFVHLDKQDAPPSSEDIDAFLANPDLATNPILAAGYIDLGHTEAETGLTFDGDEEEEEVLPTFQKKRFKRVITTPAVDSYSIVAHQIKDPQILRFYYGGGTIVDGAFKAPPAASRQPIEGSGLVLLNEGGDWIGSFNPRVAVGRDSFIDLPQGELSKVPLKATVLEPDNNESDQWWLSKSFTAPVGP